MGGDSNVAFDQGLDKTKPPKDQAKRPSKMSGKIAKFLHSKSLVDIWRELNPKSKDYTHYSSPHQSYARIDHILIPPSLVPMALKASIIDSPWSDHSLVLLSLRNVFTNKGGTHWHLNESILSNPVHAKCIADSIKDYFSTNATIFHAPNLYVEVLSRMLLYPTRLRSLQLSRYVKEVQYKDPNGKVMIFNDKGELPSPLDIVNWITSIKGGNITDWMLVGHFDGSLSEGRQLTLEPERISWQGDKTITLYIISGPKRSMLRGMSSRVPKIYSELCKKCPENEWPNKAKNICIDKVIEYLSYEEDILVLFFSIISVIFATTSFLILGLFVWFRSTPIVRANNRNLSFILLLSLILSFLSVFLFLGRPVDITCMLQQVTFGIPFTISASSILAKTIMVFIAFKATRPGSSSRKWVGVKLPNTVMLFCSSIQVMNCILWLSISPPFQEYDMDSYPGKILIQCNEGSVIGFYSMLGYMGFLAAVSFVLAFMVRTLPDSFNEAKYITFSMLVFCSVWIAMIPAYLSTRGKYMVAVEIFAILTSSTGILLCMFSPKLYILLLKPELNTRGTMLGKRML
ncbi:vomeronasal type-2 receptor 26-like [Lithobates pipiens]